MRPANAKASLSGWPFYLEQIRKALTLKTFSPKGPKAGEP